MHVGSVELELAIANQYLVDMGELVEIVVDTLDGDHGLTAVVDDHCLVFHALGGNVDLRQLAGDLLISELRGSGLMCIYFYMKNVLLKVWLSVRCEVIRFRIQINHKWRFW